MLVVKTLGKFQISDRTEILDESKLHSPMLIKLFVYMMIHRGKPLSIEEITNAVWAEEEIDNPVGALKNLMYRLRKVLNDTFGKQEYIITNRGSYTWNPEIEVLVDTDEFEKLIHAAKGQENKNAAAEKYEYALMIYEGRFINNITDLYWIHNLNAYYHTMYLDAVRSLMDIYFKRGNYVDIEMICDKALEIDPSEEQLYTYKIKAYMYAGKLKQAMEYYEIAKKRIQYEIGIHDPELLQEVYQELLSMDNGEFVEDMEGIQADVIEENPDGVFFCGYPIFKEIYQLEARKSTRSGLPNQLILFTVETVNKEPEAIQAFRIKQGMERLESVMRKALRIGDVAARYSDSQYVLMVLNCDCECGWLVANRIISKVSEGTTKYDNIKIRVDIEEVTCERGV